MIIDIGDRKKFSQVTIALTIAIILITVYILTDILPIQPYKVTKILETSYDSNTIAVKIKKLCTNFNVDTNQISHYKVAQKNIEIYDHYDISLPNSFYHILFLRELNYMFDNSNLNIIAKEEKTKNNTIITLKDLNSNQTLISIRLLKDNNFSTWKSKISILCLVDDLNDELLSFIDNLSFKTIFLFKPTDNNYQHLNQISNKNFKYGILITDNISDYKYYLKDGMNYARLKSSVFNISNNFPNAKFVVYDNTSKLAKSKVFNDIKTEFAYFFSKSYYITDFTYLKEGIDNDILSFFHYIVKKNLGKNYIIIVDFYNYKKITDSFYQLYLKGINFKYPEEITGSDTLSIY